MAKIHKCNSTSAVRHTCFKIFQLLFLACCQTSTDRAMVTALPDWLTNGNFSRLMAYSLINFACIKMTITNLKEIKFFKRLL